MLSVDFVRHNHFTRFRVKMDQIRELFRAFQGVRNAPIFVSVVSHDVRDVHAVFTVLCHRSSIKWSAESWIVIVLVLDYYVQRG